MLRGMLATAALTVCIDAAFAAAPDYWTEFVLDQVGGGLPNRTVDVTSYYDGPTSPAPFWNESVYAGVFGGYHGGINGVTPPVNDDAHRWDVFCTELNHNIGYGLHKVDVWNTFMNQPIVTGDPRDGSGTPHDELPPITYDQKFMIEGIMEHCLGLPAPRGLDPYSGGSYEQSLFAYDYDLTGRSPRKLSNEQAAATQILIWEIVHENWDYASHNASEYDPNWLRTQAPTVIGLNSGWLRWSNISGNDAAGHDISFYFNAEKDCVLRYYFQSIPEATTLLMGAMAVWPFLISRRRQARA